MKYNKKYLALVWNEGKKLLEVDAMDIKIEGMDREMFKYKDRYNQYHIVDKFAGLGYFRGNTVKELMQTANDQKANAIKFINDSLENGFMRQCESEFIEYDIIHSMKGDKR